MVLILLGQLIEIIGINTQEDGSSPWDMSLKIQICEVTAMGRGVRYLMQAVSVSMICGDKNGGAATAGTDMCAYVAALRAN